MVVVPADLEHAHRGKAATIPNHASGAVLAATQGVTVELSATQVCARDPRGGGFQGPAAQRALFDELSALRLAEAKRKGIPAYCVFWCAPACRRLACRVGRWWHRGGHAHRNKTLEQMVTQLPTSSAAFLAIEGVQQARRGAQTLLVVVLKGPSRARANANTRAA